MATVGETKFTTEIVKEVKEMTWEIKDFAMVVSSKEDLISRSRMNFSAGDTIGLPTEWQFYFEKTYSHDKLGIFTTLLKSPQNRKKVFAAFRSAIIITNTQHDFPDINELVPRDYKSNDRGYHSFIESLKDVLSQGPNSSHLVDGHLTIKIQFVLWEGFEAKVDLISSEVAEFHDESTLEITQDLGQLLESGDKADLTVQMKDGRSLKAHSAILIARSPTFSSMIHKEPSSGVILIEDLSYEAMRTILQFIYTGSPGGKWEEHLEEVIYAADKYQLTLLKKFCDKALGSTCSMKNAWELLTFAERHGLETAEKEIKSYIKTNIGGIIEATKCERHQAKKIKLDLS